MIFSILAILFITMPILEIYVLFQVFESIGGMETIALVVLTGFLGAGLARWQGMQTVVAIQADLHEGRVPAPRMMDGMMIIIAGVLLITPGLVTDTVGFLLLVPVIRGEIRMWLNIGRQGVTKFQWRPPRGADPPGAAQRCPLNWRPECEDFLVNSYGYSVSAAGGTAFSP